MWKKQRSLHSWWSFNICPRSYQQIKKGKLPSFLNRLSPHLPSLFTSVTAKDPRLWGCPSSPEVHLAGTIPLPLLPSKSFQYSLWNHYTHRELHPLLWRFSSSANLHRNLALLKWFCVSSAFSRGLISPGFPDLKAESMCSLFITQPPVHVFSFLLETLESRWTHAAAQPARRSLSCPSSLMEDFSSLTQSSSE